MARFKVEVLDNDVSGDKAWKRIVDSIRDGAKSVEVVSRTVDKVKIWEIRSWSGIRDATPGSNAAGADPNLDY